MGNVRFDPVFNIGNLATIATLLISILGMVWYLGGAQAEQQTQMERTMENRAKYIPMIDSLVAKSAAQELVISALITSSAEARADTRLLLQETARIRERLAAIEVILNRQESKKEASIETPPR